MSKNIKNELAARLFSMDQQRLEAKAKVLYNFTNIPRIEFNRDSCRREVTLFFIGNIGRRKGVFDLIDSAGRLRELGSCAFRIVLAGPCDNSAVERDLRNMIDKANLSAIVQFTGSVSGRAKELLFMNADIFVLPSYGEGIPMSLLEAMSYALPVVATSVGGIPEVVVDGESGFLIKPGDIGGLCQALRKLIESSELRYQMGRCGRARVKKYHNPKTYMLSLEAIYREVLRL